MRRKQNRLIYAKGGTKTGLELVGKNKFIQKKIAEPVLGKVVIPILGWINKVNPDFAKFLGYKEEQSQDILRSLVNENIRSDNTNQTQSDSPESYITGSIDPFKSYNVPAYMEAMSQYSSNKDIINKSFAPYFNGDTSMNSFGLYVKNNKPILEDFYKAYFRMRINNGLSLEDIQKNFNNKMRQILSDNLKLRSQAALKRGIKLDENNILDLVNKTPITFHYFPYNEHGEGIGMYYDDRNKDITISTSPFSVGTTWNKTNTYTDAIIHEIEHALQDRIGEQILQWYNNQIQDKSLSFNDRQRLINERIKFQNNLYFPEEQALLDDAYPVISQQELSQTPHKTMEAYLNKERRFGYINGQGAEQNTREQAAVNAEIKKRYITNGVDFSKLTSFEDLPDFFRIGPSGVVLQNLDSPVMSSYLDKYTHSISSDIDDEVKEYKSRNPNCTVNDVLSLQEDLMKKRNSAIKKAVYYVGSMLGGAYMLNQTENND